MANMFFLYILFLLAIFNIFVYYLINRNKPLILVVIRISSILAAMILCVLGLPADGEKNKDQIQMAIKNEPWMYSLPLALAEIGRLQDELRTRNQEVKYLKYELKKERLMLSIRSNIEYWEYKLAPELSNFTFRGHPISFNIRLHEHKWLWILKNSNASKVTELKTLIKDAFHDDEHLFCKTTAEFFTYTSNSEDIPLLHEYMNIEVFQLLSSKFNINNENTLNVVHFFLKRWR